LLVTAVRRAGRRAIIQRGWSGLTTSLAGEDVHFIDYVPYGRLFPDAACVVHHGGAGTTAATLRAGVPSVFVPHLHDQPIWAQLLYSIGCTAGIVPYDKLTVDRLSAAIARTVTSPRCHRAAQAVSQKIEAEHGNATAVEHIETLGRTAKAGFTP
jgi:UDP:flavonoid glycosyltransferase YjiC (YdhE family)